MNQVQSLQRLCSKGPSQLSIFCCRSPKVQHYNRLKIVLLPKDYFRRPTMGVQIIRRANCLRIVRFSQCPSQHKQSGQLETLHRYGYTKTTIFILKLRYSTIKIQFILLLTQEILGQTVLMNDTIKLARWILHYLSCSFQKCLLFMYPQHFEYQRLFLTDVVQN